MQHFMQNVASLLFHYKYSQKFKRLACNHIYCHPYKPKMARASFHESLAVHMVNFVLLSFSISHLQIQQFCKSSNPSICLWHIPKSIVCENKRHPRLFRRIAIPLGIPHIHGFPGKQPIPLYNQTNIHRLGHSRIPIALEIRH